MLPLRRVGTEQLRSRFFTVKGSRLVGRLFIPLCVIQNLIAIAVVVIGLNDLARCLLYGVISSQHVVF